MQVNWWISLFIYLRLLLYSLRFREITMKKHSLIAVGLTFLSASAVAKKTVYLHTPFNDMVQKIDMERCIMNGKIGVQFQNERYVGQLLQLDFIWTMDETETCLITAISN